MIGLLEGSPTSTTTPQVLPQASTEKTESKKDGSPENATADTGFMSMLFQMLVAPTAEQTPKVVNLQPDVVGQSIAEQVLPLGQPTITPEPELTDLTSMDAALTSQTVKPQAAPEANPLNALVQKMTPTASNDDVPESILTTRKQGQTTSVSLDFTTKVDEIPTGSQSVGKSQESGNEEIVVANTPNAADRTTNVRVENAFPIDWERTKSVESNLQFVRQGNSAETTGALRAISEKFSTINEITLPFQSVEKSQEVDSGEAVVPNTSDPAGRTISVQERENSPLDREQPKSVEGKPQFVHQTNNAETTRALRAISEKFSRVNGITLPPLSVERAQEVGNDEAVVPTTSDPASRTISVRVRENSPLNWESAKSEKRDVQFVPQIKNAETAKALQAISEKFSVAIPSTKQVQTVRATSDSSVERSVPLPGITIKDNTKVENNSVRSAAPALVKDEQTMNTDNAQAPKPEAEAVAEKPLQSKQAHIPTESKNEVVGSEYSESEKQETVLTNPEEKSYLGEEAAAKPDHAPKALSQTSSNREQRSEAASKTMTFDIPQTQTQSKTELSLPTRGAEKPSLPQQLPEDFARSLVIKISDELKIHIEGKSSEVRVFMKPESLGELSLRVSMEDGNLSAKMDVSQPVVKAALEAQLPQLRDALARNGIDIQRFEIVSGGETQFQQPKEGTAFQQHSQSKRQTDVDVEEKYDNVRYLGYNTVEYII